jgi:UDP-3-O-[3-hydroxymyristoyl] glucosamine N-acyltransferase
MSVSLGELAVRFGCELRGDPDIRVERVATLGNADASAISFLANPRYRQQLTDTRAGAVILDAASAAACPVAALVCSNPYATYARISTLLNSPPAASPGIHPTALVAADTKIDPSSHIGPLCVVGRGVVIGPRVVIGPHCVIEDDVSIGEDVRLVARVTLCRGVEVGPRVLLHAGAVIGADGFGFAPEKGRWIKIPQIGTVRIAADVEIGANTTIDRGALDDTIIEEGVKLDNQIQIGHGCRIGAHTAIAACTGIAGSTTIGRRCQIGGFVGMGGHLSISDDVVITGYTMVSHSIAQPGVYSSGIPLEEARAWRRLVGHFKRLPAFARRLKQLESAAGTPQGQDEEDD